MARTMFWAVLMIPIVLCIFIVYLAYFAALQEKCVEKLQYVISSSGGSHIYWNKFKLPTISWLSHIFLSDIIQEKEEHAQLHQIDPNHRGKEGLKTKLIDAAEDSLEKTKTMMEDTAKSAADIAGEAMYKTADMVKESLSKPTSASHSHPHDEL